MNLQVVNIFLFFILLLSIGCETINKNTNSADLRKVASDNECREIKLNGSEITVTAYMFENIDDGFIYHVSSTDVEGNDEMSSELMLGKLFYQKLLLGLKKDSTNEQFWKTSEGIEKTYSVLIKGTGSVEQVNVLDCTKKLVGTILKRPEYTTSGERLIYQLLYGGNFNTVYASSNTIQSDSIDFLTIPNSAGRGYGYQKSLFVLEKVDTDKTNSEGLHETWKISPDTSVSYKSSQEKSDLLILAINTAIWRATENLKDKLK